MQEKLLASKREVKSIFEYMTEVSHPLQVHGQLGHYSYKNIFVYISKRTITGTSI
jgi:hypothetical protein